MKNIRSLSIVMLSIAIVGIAVYNMLIAAPPLGRGGSSPSIGTGDAGVPRSIPRGMGARMTPGMADAGMRGRPDFRPPAGGAAAGLGSRFTPGARPELRPDLGRPIRPDLSGIRPDRSPRPDGRPSDGRPGRPDRRPDGRPGRPGWDGRRPDRWDGKGDWWHHRGWGWRRPWWRPSFTIGFFAGAPWWWGSYAYPWYSPYWNTLGLQQQIYYLQQQIAYLIQQLNYVTDTQQQYYLQEQINNYNQQLSYLTGQSDGYSY